MAVATLSIDLEARLGRLEQDLRRASTTVEREAKRMDAAFAAASATLKGFVASLAAGASVGVITQLVRSTIDGVDRLNDLADATGSTVENISALEDVALRTGTSIDTVSTALVKFNAELAGAKKGSETALILEKIGLNAAELRRIDPAQALLQTSQALAQFADDGDKARIVQALFGKSVAEVAPFLKDLADKTALVPTVTSEAAKEAEKFNQQLFALQKNTLDVARAFLGPAVSGLNAYIDKLKEAQKEGKLLATVNNDVAVILLKMAPPQVQAAAMAMRLLESRLSDRPTGPNLNSQAGAGRGFVNPPLVRPSIGGIPEAPKAGARAVQSEAEKYLETLQKQLQGTRELSVYETALEEIRTGRFQFSDKVSSKRLLDLAAEIDATKEAIRVSSERAALRNADEKAANEAARANEQAYRERLRSLLEGTESDVFKRQQADLAFLQENLERGAIDVGQYGEAVRSLFKMVKEEAKEANDVAKDLGFTFASAFEDAIIGGQKLGDVLKSLEQDITRILLRRLVTEPLAGGITSAIGAFGGSGGGWSAAVDAFMGAFRASPGRAGGGDVRAGRMYRINERGPGEVFNVGGAQYLLAGRNGSVAPNTMGGGRTLNVTVNVQGMPGMSRDTLTQQGALIGAQVQMALRRNG